MSVSHFLNYGVASDDLNDIRASMGKAPSWLQDFFTQFSGKALNDQKPRFLYKKWMHLAFPCCYFIFGVVLSAFAVGGAELNILPMIAGWIFTVAGSRQLAAVVLHQCVHYDFSRINWLDDVIGEGITILLFIIPCSGWRYEHLRYHHKPDIAFREDDPITSFLEDLGYFNAKSMRDLWILTFRTIISPTYHLGFLIRRFKQNFSSNNRNRLSATMIFWSAMIWAFFVIDSGLAIFVAAYAVPVFILFQVSHLIEILSEHGWMVPRPEIETVRNHAANQTWGRFYGAPLPTASNTLLEKIGAWFIWGIKMCGHALVRATIVVGDQPQHDFHHRRPGSPHWYNAAYARQMDIKNGHPGLPPYKEYWGLFNQMTRVFTGILNHNLKQNKEVING